MDFSTKSVQLQIRVSPSEKALIQRAAAQAKQGMSAYVLGKVLPQRTLQFQQLTRQLADGGDERFALAEINALLSRLSPAELGKVVAQAPDGLGSDYLGNTLAAMVESACRHSGVACPAWTRTITPLPQPVFGSQLESLRLYLLTHSPPAFRRRNIFVDTTIGGQV